MPLTQPTICVATLLALSSAAAAQSQTTLVSPNGMPNGLYGCAVARVPDFTGDGIDDFVIGAYGESVNGIEQAGRVYVYNGATGGLIRTIISPAPSFHGQFGAAVAGVPDANGNGRGDIVIGAPQESWGSTFACGRAYVYNGLTGQLITMLLSPGMKTGGNFGGSVSGVPDVNGDGRGDVIIGASNENPGASPVGAGRAYIYLGTGGLWQRLLPPHPVVNGFFGYGVAGLPDTNGDGRGEVVITAPRAYDANLDPPNCGRAYLRSGATGLSIAYIRSPGLEQGGRFGESVAAVPDCTGDGKWDIVVGAPLENPGLSPINCGRAYIYNGVHGHLYKKLLPPTPQVNGEFGMAVGGLPDTSGDGRGDVVVGAWKESVGAMSQAGRVHLYDGFLGTRMATYTSNNPQADSFYGSMIGGIGSTNGTGRGGILVGAAGENPNGMADAGRAYIIRR
jgi:hypothetical protein